MWKWNGSNQYNSVSTYISTPSRPLPPSSIRPTAVWFADDELILRSFTCRQRRHYYEVGIRHKNHTFAKWFDFEMMKQHNIRLCSSFMCEYEYTIHMLCHVQYHRGYALQTESLSVSAKWKSSSISYPYLYVLYVLCPVWKWYVWLN